MNVFVFAVGGTGARVLRSLSFLLASGPDCIPDGTTFVPIILDYDKTNADKTRAIENLKRYIDIRKEAYEGMSLEPNERNYFCPEIQYLSNIGRVDNKQTRLNPSFEFTFGLDKKAGAGTFAKYLDLEHMMGDTHLTRDLLNSLYNNQPTSESFTELNLDLEQGFKGNPNIGSVIFENLKDSEEFQHFFSAFDPQNDRIFIISSIFGGTGSSGFPQIVDAIRYSGIQGLDRVPMGALIVMPYFKVQPQKGGAINSNIFNSKQKAALSQYYTPDANGRNLYDKLTTTYFIGDDLPTTLPYSEGKDTQRNDAHLVELLGASAIVDFVSTSTDKLAKNPLREFGLKTEPATTEKIELGDFNNNDLEKWLDPLTCMALTFKYFESHVLSGNINPKEAYYGQNGLDIAPQLGDDWYATLTEYINDFHGWLDELERQKDGFKPFNQEPREESREISAQSGAYIAEDLGDYIAGFSAKSGGVFTNGSSYKDFDSYADKYYKDMKVSIPNDYFLLLEIYYEAAWKCFSYYSPIN